jgi:hypothetical protein
MASLKLIAGGYFFSIDLFSSKEVVKNSVAILSLDESSFALLTPFSFLGVTYTDSIVKPSQILIGMHLSYFFTVFSFFNFYLVADKGSTLILVRLKSDFFLLFLADS